VSAAVELRRVEPEWLDQLDPADARAQRCRRDLVRVNAFMRNGAIVASALARSAQPLRTWAEIGAGDGGFALGVAARLQRVAGGRVILLDRLACGGDDAAFAALGWKCERVRADAFEWLGDPAAPPLDAIVANLFLHHFEDAALAKLLAAVARRTRVFVACEPRRSGLALAGSRLIGAIGCGEVARHDAVLSVRAGFRDGEIGALWPKDGWRIEERARALFSHAFVAVRRT
jgi:hypothetical protein